MTKILKGLLNKPLKAILKRVDFVKLLERISLLDPGRSFIERETLGPAFADQAQIARLAVDLAERAAEAKGDRAPMRRELQAHVDLISCHYDWDLHRMSKAALYNIITHLFVSPDPDNLYVSRDKRELRHLDRLSKARDDGVGVVYLVNHTSHFDEFIFDLYLDYWGFQLPLFAAGQNMMATPSLTRLFMLGSYVIVRKGASRSYLSALFHYCQALAEMGKPQGIFLEAWSGGARTRDGSLRYPRRLVTIQGALASRGDVVIQPVVVSYSRVPEDLDLSEGRSLLSWASGTRITGALKSPLSPLEGLARGMRGLFGRTYVGFGEGRLLSELKEEWSRDAQGLELDEYTALYAIKEIARDKKIMASQLAALGLGLAVKRDSLDIVGCAEESLEVIRDYHSRVFDAEPDLEDFVRESPMSSVVEDGLTSLRLRRVVGSGPWFRKRLPRVLSPHGLSYYATHSDRRLYSPAGKENMVVCGAGPWGFAVVTFVGRRTIGDRKFHNSSLSLFDADDQLVQEIQDSRSRPEFPDIRLPKNVFPTSDPVEAFRKANDVIIASPPSRAGALLQTVLGAAPELRSLILAVRGFDPLTHRLGVQMAWEAAAAAGRPDVNILALSGPFGPEDLVTDKGGVWILAGPKRGEKHPETPLFRFGRFRVRESHDPLGVEIAASLADAYSLYGAYLKAHRELKGPEDLAAFVLEVSTEAKLLAMALGAEPDTFSADSPAWLAEFVYSALSAGRLPTVKIAAQKGGEALKELAEVASAGAAERWPDRGLLGYQAIHSAHLIAKHISLKTPHLERADKIFWGD
ncbi:MAG: 1-acyl-sn-glycerol-3-phosphate acyltransferase [Deltaproteobacteria bacterium]|nr:1-acyl-sn-glycerol-3-phosphate acyltransferase [Deltaproteobacteria bacterium]